MLNPEIICHHDAYLVKLKVFVESLDFVGGSKAQRSTLVDTGDFNIQDRVSGHTIGSKTSGLFDKESERSGFERQSELGRGLFGGRVGENTLTLGELLVNIRDKTSRVSKSVSVVHEVVNELLVSGNILCGTQVGR